MKSYIDMRTLVIVSFDDRRERGRLRNRHERFARQQSTAGVVAMGDAADRMAENLD